MASTVGGVGVTSLCRQSGARARVTRWTSGSDVVDLDLQTGGLAIFLNVEPSARSWIWPTPRRSSTRFSSNRALTKHPSGIYLLAAPKRIEDSEMVTDVTVGPVLDLMRQLFDFVIVDCGSYVDETSVAAWERSDRLLYVIDQSIAAARCAWRFVDLFGRLGIDSVEPRFVLNRFIHPASDQRGQLSNTLGRPLFARIPRDDKAIERVQLSGTGPVAGGAELAAGPGGGRAGASGLSSPSSHAPSEQPAGNRLLSRLRDALGSSRNREASAKA